MWAKYFTEADQQAFSGGALQFPAVTSFNYTDNLPNWQYPWHLHKDRVELVFVQCGTGLVQVEQGQLPLSTGDIAVIPAGSGHQFTARQDEPFCYYTLRFRVDSSGPLQDYFSSLPPSVTSGRNYLSYVQETFSLLLTLYEMNGGGMDETMQALLNGLLTLTRKLFTNRTLTVRIQQGYSLADVIQYINEHSAEPLTLQSIADRFHLSASHLSRLFNRAYHSSPINYLISVRMANATDLLISSNRSISEVASMVGYDNFSHFNVLFRKRIGCTPHEFRSRNAAGGQAQSLSRDSFPRPNTRAGKDTALCDKNGKGKGPKE